MHISELETPALLIDLDRMERNLSRVAQYRSEIVPMDRGVRLQPGQFLEEHRRIAWPALHLHGQPEQGKDAFIRRMPA